MLLLYIRQADKHSDTSKSSRALNKGSGPQDFGDSSKNHQPYLKQSKSIKKICNIKQLYYLERRLFL